jgi:hypothetical protein
MLVRAQGQAADATPAKAIAAGDILGLGETISTLTTVGAGTWLGAAIASGILRRSGPVGGYTDTTDTAQNILNALAGNGPFASVAPGTTFRMIFQNTVAQAMTFAAGRGVVAGVGTLDCAASLVREYLLTVLNSTTEVALPTNTTNASPTITFTQAWPLGTITPGMSVSGTGITAGSTVLGVTQGSVTDATGRQSFGISGATLSANCTATSAAPVQVTFSPTIKIDSLRAGTL